MDPQQRLILECSYAALHQAGNQRGALLGTGTGVAVGIYAMEFGQILQQNPLRASVYAVTSSALSIASGRISFVLGFHGPCTTYKTACSASLVAGHSASRALRHGDCKLHLAAGVNLMLLQASSEMLATAGMTSKARKSRTFDQRADGFARGEGAAIMVLESERDDAVGLGGSAVRQDGRSASLTAPNGQAQQGMLRAALADATASAEGLIAAEAHGTGTSLGDPIEAGSLDGAVLSHRPTLCAPVGVSGVKASIGHAESGAGLVGLSRLAEGLVRCGAPANAQLRGLNPHIRGVMRSCGGIMPTQLVAVGVADLRLGVRQGDGGVSSFGYSGTIAHVVLRLQWQTTLAIFSTTVNLPVRRRRFSWCDPSHPLLQQRLAQSRLLAVFRASTTGRLHALVAEHVVQGRVFFPGAAYLETARAAWSAATSSVGAGAGLQGVFFLHPLALDAGSDGAGMSMECVLHEGGMFEVRSRDAGSL